jgi:cytochrome c
MNNLEFNKVFASLLIAGIIAMLCGFIAKQIVHPEKLDKNVVMIEVAEVAEAADGGAGAKAAGPEPILGLIATADVAKGKQLTKVCSACHNFDKDGKNGVGPHLWGVVGRNKDAAEGFAYSGELEKQGGKVWTMAELNKFLWKPKAYAPGTKMNFMGLKKPEERAAIVAYLHSLNDSPTAMPSESEIAAEAAELAPPPVEMTPADAKADAKSDAKEEKAEAAKEPTKDEKKK